MIESDGRLRLDVKFVEGMRVQQGLWPSRITAALRRGVSSIPFGRDYGLDELPFELVLLDPDEALTQRHLSGFDLIYAGGDDFHCLGLPDLLHPGQKLVYVIEYTHETRLQIMDLDRSRSLLGRLRGRFWLRQQEKRRERAFRRATALQANGYPAYDQYAPLCSDTLLYLDGRMTPDLFATEAEMAAREVWRAAGGPMRLIFSGRLEPMKGAQDLIPVAQVLERRGTDFTLDIFGTGSLQGEIAAGMRRLADPGRVRLHGAVDFETELVPFTRTQADVFLGCHRQSDPSCTYIEAMGCGVAVASYDNRMWQRLNGEAQAGWGSPLGEPEMLAERLVALARDPDAITRASRNAWAFSQAHAFLPEFRRRMEHLARIAGTNLLPAAA
ncbi:glycosyltransferase [Tabrizicola flagellatus]|uniref:glycosyltransferase n=1 Tax=Tabrizicola flagellatus TaxID=2593021 RepID=UPI00135B556A|nr:glycosyltransferase [Tabrizicola flagellatus]